MNGRPSRLSALLAIIAAVAAMAAQAPTAPTLEQLANLAYVGIAATRIELRGGTWEGPPQRDRQRLASGPASLSGAQPTT